MVLPSHALAVASGMVSTGLSTSAPVAPKRNKKAMLSALNDIKSEVEKEEAENQRQFKQKNSPSRAEQSIVSTNGDEQRYVDQILYAVAISTEELYEKSSEERSLYNYGRLNFATAKSGIFKRKLSVEKMLQWSKKGLQSPLHSFTGEMFTEAIQFSKNIRGFMGDRSSTKSLVEHADKIIKVLLLSSQELRDELFCQLCRQLNKNPSKVSAIKGWQLFLICLTSAAPNTELMISLIEFLKTFIRGSDKDIASFAEDTLHKCYISTQLHGSRCERPNAVEVASIMNVSSYNLLIIILAVFHETHHRVYAYLKFIIFLIV